jgi:hypothetical protein
MSVKRLSWREIGLLEEGDRVIVLEQITVVPTDPGDPDAEPVMVPVNSAAVVSMNTLSKDGTIALTPDDPGLRTELRKVGSEVGSDAIFFLPTPFGDSPPPEEADVWGQAGTGRPEPAMTCSHRFNIIFVGKGTGLCQPRKAGSTLSIMFHMTSCSSLVMLAGSRGGKRWKQAT